jgi:hypothetical protein
MLTTNNSPRLEKLGKKTDTTWIIDLNPLVLYLLNSISPKKTGPVEQSNQEEPKQ